MAKRQIASVKTALVAFTGHQNHHFSSNIGQIITDFASASPQDMCRDFLYGWIKDYSNLR